MRVLRFFLAPILGHDSDDLSLGRILLFGFTACIVYSVWGNLAVLNLLSVNATLLLMVMFLVLALYCFGDKPWVREAILLLVQRLPAIGGIQVDKAATVNVQSPPEKPDPVARSDIPNQQASDATDRNET